MLSKLMRGTSGFTNTLSLHVVPSFGCRVMKDDAGLLTPDLSLHIEG